MLKVPLLIGSLVLLLTFTNLSFAEETEKLVILHTESGNLVIELFPEDAPNHVANFLNFTENGFYDDTVFHRVIKDFMIQGGDPLTKPKHLGGSANLSEWGSGDPGYFIDAEFNTIKHNRGIVSMARSSDPNSAGSQFFIVHKDSNFLDGQYTVFGRLVTQESFDTLDQIANLETIRGGDIPLNYPETNINTIEVVTRDQVSNILDLQEPERTSTLIELRDGTYDSEELGISITFPTGWIIQEPEQTQTGTPDVVAIGSKIGDIPPTISITIEDSKGKTLTEKVTEFKQGLEPIIATGQVLILSEEKTLINEKVGHTIDLISIFDQGDSVINVKFKQTYFETPEKFYTLTYTAQENYFENNLASFETAVNSFTILSVEPPLESPSTHEGNSMEGGGCLIATATYGSELAPQVQMLREIRDNSLLQTNSGSVFMTEFNNFYYSFSPVIADYERDNPIFKKAVKLAITPLITSLSILNYVDMESEAEVLGYGISLILLNIGIYFAAPFSLLYLKRNSILLRSHLM